MSKILVTGGAGYIGSLMVRDLKEKGFDIVIVDNLSSGHTSAVTDFRLEKIDLLTEKEKLDSLFKSEKFDGVVHMASFIQMGESYKDPAKYYKNNVVGFINLMDVMKDNMVKNIILSSSAGVYGNPTRVPILEDDPKNPLNPYGETKYMMERILDDYDLAYGIKYVSMRYFNAAGAAIDGTIGEAHPEESHLIPNVIKSVLNNTEFTLFGDDYDTEDGTCVRDYIHVLDLANTHSMAMQSLLSGNPSNIYNVGMGVGFSNKQVIEMIEKVTQTKVNVKVQPKREGDANSLFASNDKIKKAFNWGPKYNLEDIIKSAYLWHKNHPNGYDS